MRTTALARGLNRALGGTSRERLACWGGAAAAGLRLTQNLGDAPLPSLAAAAADGSGLGLAALQPQPSAWQVAGAIGGAMTSVLSSSVEQEGVEGGSAAGAVVATESETLAALDARAGAVGRWVTSWVRWGQRAVDGLAMHSLLLALDVLAPRRQAAPAAGAAAGAAGKGRPPPLAY